MPFRSMTGFGQAESSTSSGTYRIEIRGVNNRFLELQTRLPRFLSNLEQKVKQTVSAAISRGSVTVLVSCDREQKETRLNWDKESADAYVRIFREIIDTYGLKKEIALSDLTGFSDFIKVESVESNEKQLWNDLLPVLETALADYQKSREKEAMLIAKDLKKMLKQIAKGLNLVRKRAPVRIKNYERDLTARLGSILTREMVDPQRLAMEVALMADKRDIEEECTRLNAHLSKFAECFEVDEPVGKRLNFLLQEMNREANTIGSKANDTEIAHLSVELKEYIEKIREQIQNIE